MMLTSPPEPSELERARARHDDVVGRAHQIKRQRSTVVGAVVVAVVLIAVAVPLTFARSSGNGREVVTTSPPPAPSTSAAPTTTGGGSNSTTPTTLAAPLARGQEAPRSAIPWSQVGPGWTLALWSPAPAVGPGDSIPASLVNAPQTLFLVNPVGGRYTIGTFPDGLVVGDWSAAGRVALLGNYAEQPIDVVDLETGVARPMAATADSPVLMDVLTKPNGRAVLTVHRSTSTPATYSLVRVGLDGAHQLTYPTDLGQVGAFNGGWLSSTDGTELVFGAAKGLALVGNDGQVLRQLTIPSGEPGAVFLDCSPERWWDASTVVVGCSGAGLWLVPTDGTAPRRLTVNETGTVDLGDQNAWRIGSTTYVQAQGACGYQYLASVNPNGTTTPVQVPGVPSGDSVIVIGLTGSRLELQTTVGGCGSGESLVWYDPGANTTVSILGPPLNGGGVTSAFAYGRY